MKARNKFDVVVIGGGPAGMTAAGRAAERGRSVILVEKNKTLGKKLLISGGGRCNFTNNKTNLRELLSKYGESDKFLFTPFSKFGVKETIDFFNNRGMGSKEEPGGRMFPISDKSQSVLDVLVVYMKQGNVSIKTNSPVTEISKNNEGYFTLKLKDGSEIESKSCIVAFGGTSHPETGSTGEGFGWLKKMGHGVEGSDVSLVPIVLKNDWIKHIGGVTLDNIKLTVFTDGKKRLVKKGRILFTHNGISGPMVLNMSNEIRKLLTEGKVTIMLDLFPEEDMRMIMDRLKEMLIKESNKKIKNTITGLMPAGLVSPVLKIAEIDSGSVNNSITKEQRNSLAMLLKAIPLEVEGLMGKDKAIITSGGVSLNEIDFRTMQSKIIPNLYMAGDVLNIDRPSGGYSLQLCWTTGYIAGDSC